MKHTSILIALFSCLQCVAQVDIDKPINLLGNSTDAKISGIKDVSGAQDAVSVEKLQAGSLIYALASGSGSPYVVNLSPAIGSYTPGMVVNFKAAAANTGAVSVNVNGLGAVAVKKSANTDLVAGDINTNQLVSVVYDGTNFQLLSKENTLPLGSNLYIQNQNLSAQAANAYISGSIRASSIRSNAAGVGYTSLMPGSASQAGYLEIYKGDAATRIGYIGFSNTDLTIVSEGTATTQLLGGNVGIGVAPSARLDVNGVTRTSGFQLTAAPAAGFILRSDASGNGSWVNPGSTLSAGTGISISGNTITNSAPFPANGLTGSGTATRVALWNGTNSLNAVTRLNWDDANSELEVGWANLANAYNAGTLQVNGGTRVRIGTPADNSTSIGYSFEDDGDSGFFAEAGSNSNTIGALQLRVNGTMKVRIPTGGTSNVCVMGQTVGSGSACTSDIRFKTNVANLQNSLTKVLQLRGVTYQYDTLKFPDRGFSGAEKIGFIAQEIEKVFPQVIIEEGGYKYVDYASLTSVLAEAIKEQQSIIESLKSQNNQMQTANQQVVADMGALKAEVKILKEMIGMVNTAKQR